MNCTSTRIPYRQTGAFSKIAMDYIDQSPALKQFFTHSPTLQGIQKAIEARKQFATNRTLLVDELKKQYASIETSEQVKKNIELLLSNDAFTITTAHQNNIFTGPLYFIYKIVHAIKLADHLNSSSPKQKFVPVFYMGSEDADLNELNHIYLGGEKLTWNTKQTGAVGRMRVDKELVKLIGLMEGQLTVLPNGKEVINTIKEYYKEGSSIQDSTFKFINHLFAAYGLIVLLPDNAALKKQMIPIFKDELLKQTSSAIVAKTNAQLEKEGYKTQANPGEINLFYLLDDKREKIEKKNKPRLPDGQEYSILNTQFSFDENSLLKELGDHPERFSPNVILRGLYQETILPNVAFIGGGGETAYWLQLKGLFENYKIPFPVLLLRNSFLIVEKKWQETALKLGFSFDDLFLPEQDLLKRIVMKESANKLKLNGTFTETEQLYNSIKKKASLIDTTLEKHVESLKVQSLHRLEELEKKMLRAEKRKFADQRRQIHSIKENLFPDNGLQERQENLSYYYAKWGKDFISKLYEHSLSVEQEFVVLNVEY